MDDRAELPAPHQYGAGAVSQVLLTLAKRKIIDEGRGKNLRDIIRRDAACALPFERRDDSLCGVPGPSQLLRVVRSIRDNLRIGIRHEHIKALGVVLLEFQLERVIDRVSVVFIQSLKRGTELREGQERLSNRRRTVTPALSHIRDPSWIWGRDTMEGLSVRGELVIQLGSACNRAVRIGAGATAGGSDRCFERNDFGREWIQDIDRLQARRESRALVSHVRYA